MQDFYSDNDLVQSEAMVIREAADVILRTTRKRARGLLRDNVEGEEIIVVPDVLPKRSRKKPVIVYRSTATKQVSTLSAVNDKKNEEDDHS